MLCNEFICQMMDGNECSKYGGACMGEPCEIWGECRTCQQISEDPCTGLLETPERGGKEN